MASRRLVPRGHSAGAGGSLPFQDCSFLHVTSVRRVSRLLKSVELVGPLRTLSLSLVCHRDSSVLVQRVDGSVSFSGCLALTLRFESG